MAWPVPTATTCTSIPLAALKIGNTCENNPICSNAYHCAIRVGCLDAPSVDLFINCALGCANEAGLIDFSDPAFLQMYAIFTCASAGCGASCQFAKGADASLH